MLQCVYLLEDPEMSLRTAVMATFSGIMALVKASPEKYPSVVSFMSSNLLRHLTQTLSKAPFKRHEYIIKSVSTLFL